MADLADLELSRGRVVPGRLLSVRFARSGGPGGQNVNKVETKVDLRLDLAGAVEVLGAPTVARIRANWSSRIDADDRLQIVCDEHRSQARNLDTARSRMIEILEAALRPPKRRRPTKPTRGSVERRLAQKQRRGDIKRRRRPPNGES